MPNTAERRALKVEDQTALVRNQVTLALTGSGGAGVITAGEMLLNAAAVSGLYGLMTRSTGPQIRGGEAAALVTLSREPVEIHQEAYDLLVAVDWLNTDRFAAEIALHHGSLVIGDREKSSDAPAFATQSGAHRVDIPFKETATDVDGGRLNMVALGCICALLGIEGSSIEAAIRQKLEGKGEAVIDASLKCLQAGADALVAQSSDSLTNSLSLELPLEKPSRWLISGNEAAGLGAVRGGVRFAAAYPITPATEVLEWLAPALDKVGGTLVQAEDELASINMIIGASYGGVPSVTATSGPGLALMIESIGLATSSEVPVVIIDVMRGGPSTGMPTKSEQADLNIAVYGMHGDAPHLVVAPMSISDCLFTTQWAVHLAEAMQTPAIVLSDQFIGQAKAVVDPPANVAFIAHRDVETAPNADYFRYALTESGISPMALPGTPGGQYTADGLEHSPRGTPSSRAEDHVAQSDKRRRKIERFDYGDHWAVANGEGEIALLTWGSTTEAVRQGALLAEQAGLSVRVISLRLLLPAQPQRLGALLNGVRTAIVIEQSEGAQFYRYLRAFYALPESVTTLSQPGPLPISPRAVFEKIQEASGQ